MKKLLVAAIAALMTIMPGVAAAQSRIFQFTADALDVDNDGRKYGLTAQGSFFADGGVASGGSTIFTLTGVRSGTVTFYNDYNPGNPLRTSDVVELASFPPSFVPPQQIVLAADGSLASADFTLGLSDFPYTASFSTAAQSVFFGGEGIQTLNVLQVSEISAAVPEPAAWALMIVGFGATGAAMRRRRTRVAFA